MPFRLITFVVSNDKINQQKGDSTKQKVKEQKHKYNSDVELLHHEGNLAIEEMLQINQQKFIQETIELEEYLGRKRYEHRQRAKGYRNGSYRKKVMLPGSSISINKPHFRNVKEKFTSRILHGIAQLSEKLRMVALEMYVRGLSTRDIEATLREPNGKPMFSRSIISTLSERLYEQYKEFQE